MDVATFEGIVEQGQIRLKTSVHLPEKTKVYVIVPNLKLDFQNTRGARISSPRLAHPEQAVDFEMQIVEGPPDASV